MDLQRKRSLASIQSLGSSGDEILDCLVKKIQACFEHSSPPADILDVGCGQGHLLGLLQGIFPDAMLTGSDYTLFENFPHEDFTFLQQDANENFSKSFRKFDLVVASEVIEHLENGRHFMRQLANCIKPRGLLVVSTPNIESVTSLISFICRGYHSSFGPGSYPAHINGFSSWELNTYVDEISNLTHIETGYTNNGRMPGTVKRWQDIFPFMGGKRFSDNFYVLALAK